MRQKLLISPSGSKLKFDEWLLVPITTIMRVTVTFLLFEVYQFLWIVLNNEIKNSINICHYAYMYWLLQGIHVFCLFLFVPTKIQFVFETTKLSMNSQYIFAIYTLSSLIKKFIMEARMCWEF